MTTTLLVSCDPALGEQIAAALERVGVDVMWCRGPSGADCVCPAIRGTPCALTSAIDAVVVDTVLADDGRNSGFRSSQLVAYYERLGVPLIVLTSDCRASLRLGPQTVALSRRSAPMDVVATVHGAIAHRRSSAELERPA